MMKANTICQRSSPRCFGDEVARSHTAPHVRTGRH